MNNKGFISITVLTFITFLFLFIGVIMKPVITSATFLSTAYDSIETFNSRQKGMERYLSNFYTNISFNEKVNYSDLEDNPSYEVIEIDAISENVAVNDTVSNSRVIPFLINNETNIYLSTLYYTLDYELNSGYDIEVYDPNGNLIGTVSDSSPNLMIEKEVTYGNYGEYTLEVNTYNSEVRIDLDYIKIIERHIKINNYDGVFIIENQFPINKIYRWERVRKDEVYIQIHW